MDSVSVKQELTSTPDNRHLRLPTPKVPLTTSPLPSLASQGAISSHSNATTSSTRQDVPQLLNAHLRPVGQPSTIETSVSNTKPIHQHVVTNNNKRLRTSTSKVFASSSDLAAHYGIPQILPPPPPVTTQTHRVQPAEHRQPQQYQHALPDFDALKNSYLNMLASNPNDTAPAGSAPAAAPVVAPAPFPNREAQGPAVDTQQNLDELINFLCESKHVCNSIQSLTHNGPDTASPEFKDNPNFGAASSTFDMNQFLTSPLPELLDDFDSPDETPFQDFLTTPRLGIEQDFAMMPDMNYDPNAPIFPLDEPVIPTHKEQEPLPAPAALDMQNLYTISPGTPMIDTPAMDPGSLYPVPRLPTSTSAPASVPAPASPAPSASSTRRRSTATGTRKGITPESLVPIDAPTQPRKYVTPSATSRKELPAVFARKRARSTAFGEEEDELEGEKPPGPNATEREQIEWKRRQNTIAARKSRKRKLEHQKMLEERSSELERERDKWRTRALTFRQLLVSHGIPFREFED